MATHKQPRHIVVVSDLHVGCQLGLCPPGGVALDEAGEYNPSAFQRKVWWMWRHFWDIDVPKLTEGEPYHVVVNGDVVDGSHHGSTHQWSHNLNDQAKAALEILRPIRERCPGNWYMIRGTEAHVGKSGEREEEIAATLEAVPSADGKHARYELWKWLPDEGCGLVHFLHHVGTTSSSAYEATAVYKELVESYVEAARWDERPPDWVVRSHRHRLIEASIPTARGRSGVVVTPGWQGKTPFAWRIAGARQAQPQFGGVILSWSDSEKIVFLRHRVWHLGRDKPE